MEDKLSDFLKIAIPIVFSSLLVILAVVRVYEYWVIEKMRYESEFGNGAGTSIEGLLINHPYESGGMQAFELASRRVRTTLYPKYIQGQYLIIDTSKCPISDGYSEMASGNGNARLVSNSKPCYYPPIIVDEGLSNQWLMKLAGVRAEIVNRVQNNISEPHAGLILGMTIGYKEDFPQDFKDILINTGVIHVIVVSGYNVSLILGFIGARLIKLGRGPYIVITIFILLIYTLIVGLDPPVLRAVAFGVINIFALAYGMAKNSVYLLVLIGLIMVIIHPQNILSISYQMSFVATIAVIIASSIFSEIDYRISYSIDSIQRLNKISYVKFETKKIKLAKAIRYSNDLLILVLVNIMLTPVISYYFGRVSLLSIPANLLVLWTVPLITIGGVLFMLGPNIVIGLGLTALIDYFVLVCGLLNQYKSAIIEKQLNISEVVIYYIVTLMVLRLTFNLIKKDE